MALRELVYDGDPRLTKVCRPVTKFDDRLKELVEDMKETMLEHNGVGLAAPQVGVLRRVFVALEERPEENADDETIEQPKILAFINPEIVEDEGAITEYEGCLSLPGRYGAVERPQRVVVKAQNVEGEPFTHEADAMLARCLCHETDHLNGITFDTLAEYFYDPENPRDLDEEDEDDTL